MTELSARVSWDDAEQTICKVEYSGTWSWEAFAAIRQEYLGLRGDRSDRFDIVHCFDANMLPAPDVLLKMRDYARLASPQIGLIMIVGGTFLFNRYAQMFQEIFADMARNWRYAGTIEEARAIIAQDRAAQLASDGNDGT